MKIHEISEESRPRERLEAFGAESLSDAELLSIIFGMGTKGYNVVDMSHSLLSRFSLDEIFECSTTELQETPGIGKAKAMQLISIGEIMKRQGQNKHKIKITKAKDVFDLFFEKMKAEKQEHFFILLLDTKNKVISKEKISMGILDASIIHPREIFKPAIKKSASRIILVHNHPSGDPRPSEEDLSITEKLIDAGELIGIEVLDHVIIGYDYWSYVEK